MGSFIRPFTASAGLEEKGNRNTATVNHRTSPRLGRPLYFQIPPIEKQLLARK
jgi:hypothetical protein